MSEKLLVSAYLNIGNIWHHDAKVIGTCWGFQLVHNITEQIAMNNPNKSLPMVMLDDANAALAAKDARIAELEAEVQRLDAGWHEANKQALEQIIADQQQDEPCAHSDHVRPADRICIECGEKVAATHSEDGRDDIQVVGKLFRHDFGNVGILFAGDHDMHIKDGDEVMTVAQHERILKAKDAEIVRQRRIAEAMQEKEQIAQAERTKLALQLAAQPARQVGGDERAKFNAWNNGTDCPLAGRDTKTGAWMAWKARAALAPAAAAVILPEREEWDDLRAQGYNNALDRVTRLNRRAIPVGLLERFYEANVTPEDFDALGALLGKEGE